MKTGTILVCGGRDYRDAALIFETLDDLAQCRRWTKRLRVVHGDARGADTIADVWARVRGYTPAAYPADWDRYKSDAGRIRNAEMIEKEQIELVIAFHGRWGTRDMVAQALAHGIPIIEVSEKGERVSK